MAIKKRTPVPTQKEIKSIPQVFSEQEIQQLKDLRYELDKITIQFGQITFQKIKLEQSEKELKAQLEILEKKEKDTAKILSDKYGKGSIDLETGTFTPTE
jgi:S-adenosylmethionine:tRNA-ribosyltransferase-isomerase (queuine synthetase)